MGHLPDLYSASCQHRDGATWLEVTSIASPTDTRPVVNEDITGAGTGPAWGYHVYEAGLTLGNLLHDVVTEETAREGHR